MITAYNTLWGYIKHLLSKEEQKGGEAIKPIKATNVEPQIKDILVSEIDSINKLNDLGLKHPKFVKPVELKDEALNEIKQASDESRAVAQKEALKQYRPLDLIARSEGTYEEAAKKRGYNSGYDVTLGYGKFVNDKAKPLTKMTLKEVYELQKKMKQHPKNKFYTGRKDKKGNKIYYPSSAVGRYQFVEPTLRGLAKKLKLKDDTLFTPEVQDKLATELLNEAGLPKLKQGKITKDDFLSNVSKQWASVANPFTGNSYYGQHTETFKDDWYSVLDNVIGG